MEDTDLNAFIKDSKKFIKIKAGETFVGVYHGHSIITDPFDNSDSHTKKKTVQYRLQENGSEKILPWRCGQFRVADDFVVKKISGGTKISIQRIGDTATSTRYVITVL